MGSLITEAEPLPLKPVSSIKSLLTNIGLIASGCIVFAIGMNAVMLPHQLYSGGLAGIAILIKYHIPFLNIGPVYFLLNIPLLVSDMSFGALSEPAKLALAIGAENAGTQGRGEGYDQASLQRVHDKRIRQCLAVPFD